MREAWEHTSWITAAIINWSGRVARKKVKPEDVNPLTMKGGGGGGIRIRPGNIGILKAVYVDAARGRSGRPPRAKRRDKN